MKKYKLTTKELTTHNDFQWEVGVVAVTDGSGGLCGPGWLHYYHHPLLAIFLNPVHAEIEDPLLWEVEAGGEHIDDLGLKGGCTEMTLINQMEAPVVSTAQRLAFGILCAKQTCEDEGWNAWADKWLSGEDRSKGSVHRNEDGVYKKSAAAHYSMSAAKSDAYFAAYYSGITAQCAAKYGVDLISAAEKAITY